MWLAAVMTLVASPDWPTAISKQGCDFVIKMVTRPGNRMHERFLDISLGPGCWCGISLMRTQCSYGVVDGMVTFVMLVYQWSNR